MLIFGVLWYVLLLDIAIFGVLVAGVAFEKPFQSLVLFLAAVAATLYLSGHNPIDFAVANLGNILLGTLVYLVVGFIYAYIKWTFFYLKSDRVKREVETSFTMFKREEEQKSQKLSTRVAAAANVSPNPPITKSEDELFDEFVDSVWYPFGLSKDKWKISTWIIWWPVNFLWTMLDDVVVKIIDVIATGVSSSFANIARNQARNIIRK